MRAVRIHKFGGGPQDLVYEEDVTQPHPKEGEILRPVGFEASVRVPLSTPNRIIMSIGNGSKKIWQ